MITVLMGTEVLKMSVGRDTIGGGVGVGPRRSGGKNPSCRGGVEILGSSCRAAFCATATVSDCGLPGAAPGAALKLDANKIAETDSRATERVIWSADARAELSCRFFILFLDLAQIREVLDGAP